MTTQSQSQIKIVYESVKPIVWVLRFEDGLDGNRQFGCQTAFAVGNGKLMTCCHGDWSTWPNLIITCRPLGTDEFKYKAHISCVKPNLDMCLLDILGVSVCDFGTFGTGILDVGDEITMVSHPAGNVGTCVTGNVLFPCIENAIQVFNEEEKCGDFISNSRNVTPPYLIMGHMCNKKTIEERARIDDLPTIKFEQARLANIPIVLCSGLDGTHGSSGGPIFNLNKEIVGMCIQGSIKYQTCIHVSAIKLFLEMADRHSRHSQGDVPM